MDNVVIGLVTPTSTPTQDTTPALTLCKDGTYSSSTSSEMCSGHGGIATATPAAQITPVPTETAKNKKNWINATGNDALNRSWELSRSYAQFLAECKTLP